MSAFLRFFHLFESFSKYTLLINQSSFESSEKRHFDSVTVKQVICAVLQTFSSIRNKNACSFIIFLRKYRHVYIAHVQIKIFVESHHCFRQWKPCFPSKHLALKYFYNVCRFVPNNEPRQQ